MRYVAADAVGKQRRRSGFCRGLGPVSSQLGVVGVSAAIANVVYPSRTRCSLFATPADT
jgi:hypothetical protein